MTAPLLNLTNINKSFGPIDVLFDISLDVKSEAAFGLLGAAARAAIPYLQKSCASWATMAPGNRP